MRLLVDTHILLWATDQYERLSRSVRHTLADPANEVFLSVASVWEIAIKCSAGRLRFPLERLDELMAELGMTLLPITAPHAIAAGGLPRHHADPFDRLLIGQAVCERLTLVTTDQAIRRYDVSLLDP